jgi:hypothetical protein
MPKTPTPDIQPQASARARGGPGSGVVLAVYAPFGNDPVLSTHPAASQQPILNQPIVQQLLDVAREGTHVCALIDLYRDDTWLVEIPAHAPQRMMITSAWKQQMEAPQALAGFLKRAHARFHCAHMVLALEGHGSGYLPEIDRQRLTPASSSDGGTLEWRLTERGAAPYDSAGNPVLPGVPSPELGGDSPEFLPAGLPMSSWALAEALRLARKGGVPAPVLIHFDNCFNMALEHLHAVSDHTGWATGYANYNFFTAGAAYPDVFRRLRLAGGASAGQLATWFAAANQAELAGLPGHPSVGATIDMRRLRNLAAAVDRMAKALTEDLRRDRALALPRIHGAVKAALQYDSNNDYKLDVPDQTTDLGSLADRLLAAYTAGTPVALAAAEVLRLLKGVWQYGENGASHMAPAENWDFSSPKLGMGILLPDPDLRGVWDWRSPYYMAGAVDPNRPPALWRQIPWLADRAGGVQAPWPEFIEEYHRGVKFVSLERIQPPVFPVYAPKDPGPNDPRQVKTRR